MLSKLFRRSSRPNRMTGRRGPSLALETLETRTVMTAGLVTISTLPVHLNSAPDMPAMISVSGGPSASFGNPATAERGYSTADVSATQLGPVSPSAETPPLDMAATSSAHGPIFDYQPICVN
jgi:hypothetical protein